MNKYISIKFNVNVMQVKLLSQREAILEGPEFCHSIGRGSELPIKPSNSITIAASKHTTSFSLLKVPKDSPIHIEFHPSQIRLGPFHLNLGSRRFVGVSKDNSKKLIPFLDTVQVDIGIYPPCPENKTIPMKPNYPNYLGKNKLLGNLRLQKRITGFTIIF